MISFLKFCKSGNSERDRLLSMFINDLNGYILVEIATLAGKASGFLNISYRDIFILSLAANISTIILILILYCKTEIKPSCYRILFLLQFIFYILIIGVTAYLLRETRYVILIYALLALIIDLPFSTMIENTIIAVGSILCYLVVSYIAIDTSGQPGLFNREILYSILILPLFIVLSYVSRQINLQKLHIETGKEILQQVNEKLLHANNILRRARNLTDHDMSLAAHVQHAFLPETPQDLSDWDTAVYFRPFSNVSGDCYDFYVKDKQLRGVSMFDVSGHGLSSGLLTMIVKPTTTRYFSQMQKQSLGRILSKVNESIVKEFSVLENYITGTVLRLDGDTAEYVNAGHPEILIKYAGDNTADLVQDEDTGIKGQPIGLSRSYPYRSIKFTVNSGDTILLYTDCVIESCDNKRRSFGIQRLIEKFATAPDSNASDILDYIIYNFFLVVKDEDVEDDLTVMVLKKR